MKNTDSTDRNPTPVDTAKVQPGTPHLQRVLTLRHIMFIALGSAIGTGLFLRFSICYPVGWAFGAGRLHGWRRSGVHGDARYGRVSACQPGFGGIFGVRYPLLGALGGFCDRLELRPGDGAGRYCGCDGVRRLYAVLVP